MLSTIKGLTAVSSPIPGEGRWYILLMWTNRVRGGGEVVYSVDVDQSGEGMGFIRTGAIPAFSISQPSASSSLSPSPSLYLYRNVEGTPGGSTHSCPWPSKTAPDCRRLDRSTKKTVASDPQRAPGVSSWPHGVSSWPHG
eukprot:2009962-Pyramimonas_sp.AAC.1